MNLSFFNDEDLTLTEQSISNPTQLPEPVLEPKFTQEDLNRIGATESRKAKQALLKQLGISEEDIPTTVTELKAFKEKQAQQLAEAPEIERLKAENTRLAEIEKFHAEATAELTKIKQQNVARAKLKEIYSDAKYSKGIESYNIKHCLYDVQEYVDGGMTFEEALEKTLKENPPQAIPPLPYSGGNKQAIKKKQIDMNQLLFGGLAKK